MATTGGQTLNDRLNAARYALAGQGLARVVCKATTEELLAPKKKHLDYLLQCTYEANVSIPQLANLLIERTGHNSWIVVFKALITVHNLMCFGNERFTQYLASSNCSFQLSNFLDKTGVKGYDMSTYIRRYAKYLNEKALSYRLVALDFAKMKRGKEEGALRTMTNDKLLKTLPILQNQIDALLEFDCTATDLSNNIINGAFMLLFRDLIRLFACYNDGIINLLEKYFEMQRKQCREALDIYKKFLIRMDKVAEFLKVAENIGINKQDIPDLTKAPSSLLEALEAHLNSLEAKGKRHKEKHGKGHTTDDSKPSATGGQDDDQLKKALEEEAAAMNQLKFDKLIDVYDELDNLTDLNNLNDHSPKADYKLEQVMDENNNKEFTKVSNNNRKNYEKLVFEEISSPQLVENDSDDDIWCSKIKNSIEPMEKHVKDKPFSNPFLDATPDLASFDTSASSTNTSTSKSSSNDIIDLFGANGGSSTQPSNNLLTNQTSNNLLFSTSSNQNGALHTQLNMNTINSNTAALLENGNSSISSNLGLKSNHQSNSDLLGVLANNSQSFHSNIFSQNHINNFATTIQSLNPYPNSSSSNVANSSGNQLAFNYSPASTSSPFNQLHSGPMHSMPTQTIANSTLTNTVHSFQSMQPQNYNLNINGNNLLMNPAFTAASSNPFASGFANQPATSSGGSTGTTSNTNFEPNFANAFGSASNTSTNGSAFDAFGDILQPQKSTNTTANLQMNMQSNSSQNSMLSMMNNLNNNSVNSKQSTILKGDLDSTLADLALNLDLKPKKMPTKY